MTGDNAWTVPTAPASFSAIQEQWEIDLFDAGHFGAGRNIGSRFCCFALVVHPKAWGWDVSVLPGTFQPQVLELQIFLKLFCR